MNGTARIVLACAPTLPAPVLAQQTTGMIAGRVVDEQGAGIAGTTVTAANADTGFVRAPTSDGSGLYCASLCTRAPETTLMVVPLTDCFRRAEHKTRVKSTLEVQASWEAL